MVFVELSFFLPGFLSECTYSSANVSEPPKSWPSHLSQFAEYFSPSKRKATELFALRSLRFSISVLLSADECTFESEKGVSQTFPDDSDPLSERSPNFFDGSLPPFYQEARQFSHVIIFLPLRNVSFPSRVLWGRRRSFRSGMKCIIKPRAICSRKTENETLRAFRIFGDAILMHQFFLRSLFSAHPVRIEAARRRKRKKEDQLLKVS